MLTRCHQRRSAWLLRKLGIESVLTTQVINLARSSVRECDLARRMCTTPFGITFRPNTYNPNWSYSVMRN